MKFTKVLAINRKTTPLEKKKEEKELFLLPLTETHAGQCFF
jgi:hypothetical protein